MGEGGVAVTYFGARRLARGARGDQRAALKEIHEEKWADPEFREQFWAEVEAVASLRSGKIVSILEIQPKLGRIVLELVDGVDLQRLVSALPSRRLPWDLVALIAREMCYGLGYAHRRRRGGEEAGVIHRDVKASNVLISYEGEVKLTDFGLAKIVSNTGPHSRVIRGTIESLSPEQTRPELVLDGRSDLFSLGSMLYELLTGQRPFYGATDADLVYAIREGNRRPVTDHGVEAPAEFFAIIERLMATEREDRFASAEDVLDQLENLQAPHRVRELGRLARMAVSPMTSSVDLDEHRPGSRARWLAPAISIALLASVGLGTARSFSHTPTVTSEARRTPGHRSADERAPATTSSAPSEALLALSAPRPLISNTPESPPSGSNAAPATAPESLGPTAPESLSHAIERPSRTQKKPHPSSAGKHAAEGVLVTVGSVPLPQVDIWVDGEPHGRGPANVVLKPGPHVFAAGRGKPEYTVTETVTAGVTEQAVTIQRAE